MELFKLTVLLQKGRTSAKMLGQTCQIKGSKKTIGRLNWCHFLSQYNLAKAKALPLPNRSIESIERSSPRKPLGSLNTQTESPRMRSLDLSWMCSLNLAQGLAI